MSARGNVVILLTWTETVCPGRTSWVPPTKGKDGVSEGTPVTHGTLGEEGRRGVEVDRPVREETESSSRRRSGPGDDTRVGDRSGESDPGRWGSGPRRNLSPVPTGTDVDHRTPTVGFRGRKRSWPPLFRGDRSAQDYLYHGPPNTGGGGTRTPEHHFSRRNL